MWLHIHNKNLRKCVCIYVRKRSKKKKKKTQLLFIIALLSFFLFTFTNSTIIDIRCEDLQLILHSPLRVLIKRSSSLLYVFMMLKTETLMNWPHIYMYIYIYMHDFHSVVNNKSVLFIELHLAIWYRIWYILLFFRCSVGDLNV